MVRSGSTRARRRRGGGFFGLLAALAPFTAPLAAPRAVGAARTLDTYLTAFALLARHDHAARAVALGIRGFAVVTAIALGRARGRAAQAEAAARAESPALKAVLDRAVTMLLSEPQVLVVWAPADDEPEILGDTAL